LNRAFTTRCDDFFVPKGYSGATIWEDDFCGERLHGTMIFVLKGSYRAFETSDFLSYENGVYFLDDRAQHKSFLNISTADKSFISSTTKTSPCPTMMAKWCGYTAGVVPLLVCSNAFHLII
jgi:hypothetical protein